MELTRGYARVGRSREGPRVALRVRVADGFESSGGSERSDSASERGLEGGWDLSSCAALVPGRCTASRAEPETFARAGDAFTCRENSSKGRMTRAYEFLSCVDRPGIPV